MNKHFAWLYVEPFVHISITKYKALLYNTLNGMCLEYSSSKAPYNLITQLSEDDNLLVIGLGEDVLKLSETTLFIEKLRKTFMGDIIHSNVNAQKPIQIKPIFNVQKDIKTITDAKKSFIGTKIMEELSDITIYINDYCSLNCLNCQESYKQFLYCHKSSNTNQSKEIDIKTIEFILESLRAAPIKTIKISGGNILKYSKLKKLYDLFEYFKIIPEFCIYYENIVNDTDEALIQFADRNVNFIVFLDNTIDSQSIIKITSSIASEKITFIYIVSEIADVERGGNLLNDLGVNNCVFLPYYNSNNLPFFQKYVFVDKKSVFAGKPSMSEIHARMVINPFSFGKLQIMTNGDVYANINENILGNIRDLSLCEIAYKSMIEITSWKKTRDCVLPCNSCIYRYLCPPISNYEYAIGKFNLCKISNQK